MGILHMQTDEVRQVAGRLGDGAARMMSLVDALHSAVGGLATAWQGDAADEFLQLQLEVVRSLEGQAQSLQGLALRVSREVDEWENADGAHSAEWRSSVVPLVTTSLGGMTAPPAAVALTAKDFDWYKFGEGATKSSLELLGRIPYDSVTKVSYKRIGRLLNLAVGSQRAGWVTRMDTLGHIIRNPAVSQGLPLGLGIVGDLLDGDDLGRAVGSEFVEFALDAGISLVPVVGQFYAGYQLFLSLGDIYAGVLEARGSHDEAVWLQNTLEELDFTDRLGDAIYDFAANYTANGAGVPVDLAAIAQTVAQYGCGSGGGTW